MNNFGETVTVSVTVLDFFEDGQTHSECEEWDIYFGHPTGAQKGDLTYHMRQGQACAPHLYERGFTIKDLASFG